MEPAGHAVTTAAAPAAPAVPGRLAGTAAVVTGAAGGLGRAIAERLAAEGSAVAVLDIKAPWWSGPDSPEGIGAWHCDVTNTEEIRDVVDQVAQAHGGIDILVNAAGLLSGRASLLETTPEDLQRYFSVNAAGALSMVQACHPYLKASRHRGRIINVASRTFFTGSPGQLAYVASKGALIGMTRVMARELGPDRITANAVMPAQVATPGTLAHSSDDAFAATMAQQAIQEFVTPEHFAGLVAYLASPDGALVTGQSLVCDGGGLLH
ncbi:pyridoxal 4-dehydrogenase [Zafaria cholistanensis]|uniref:Pyridoxal 4-dehydrogenase n=1 Tax=Zafaria cholistanensis TaxID=1682741 RepID=A0A5A7NU09_9MICC|nr:SDR family oxidoreductase [Zafaria cholistanensis]GER23241.1 pyridoxal 4-dehydrogenase [Zafaria cholistanensis]